MTRSRDLVFWSMGCFVLVFFFINSCFSSSPSYLPLCSRRADLFCPLLSSLPNSCGFVLPCDRALVVISPEGYSI